jgi:hypothetical protein
MREGDRVHDARLGSLRLIGGVAALLVLAIVAALMLQGGGAASRTASFRAAGLYLEYPAAWQAVRPPSHPADREWLVLLTDQPALPDPCGSASTGSPAPAGPGGPCPVLHYVVDPGAVVVTVTVFYDSSPQEVLRSQGVRGAGPATVDGRQGWTGVVDPTPGSDAEQAVVWILPMTASSGAAYEIRADLRGPQLSQRLEEVRRIVASVQL